MSLERRAVLKGVATLTVGDRVVGTSGAAGDDPGDAGSASRRSDGVRAVQGLDTELSPGVTLFDLNGDGEYTARVEQASGAPLDDAHPQPIRVTSNGHSTVDFATSIVAPSAETTLGGLDELAYDYYEGPNNANPDRGGAAAPDETFLVVENADGRHGMYLTYDGGPTEEWATFDVLARIRGDTAGTSGWFEYTAVEGGYDGRNFDNVVRRFGEDARLVRVGVGHGDAVNPATLDVYFDNLVVNGTASRFPVSVAKRVSQGAL